MPKLMRATWQIIEEVADLLGRLNSRDSLGKLRGADESRRILFNEFFAHAELEKKFAARRACAQLSASVVCDRTSKPQIRE